MKRRIISLALVLVCLLGMTGCHGKVKRSAFVIPEEFDTSRQYEITFWAKNDTNVTQVSIYEKAIEDFQKLYPNIKVNLRLYTDYGKIYNDVITNLATGTTPNVCITYPDHIATYMTGENTVVPLSGLFANEKYGLGGSELRFDGPTKEEIIPQFLEECKLSGEYYAVPYMRSTEACYVNKTYVEKLGFTMPETLTWDFIWEVSEAAMQKDAEGNFLVNGQKTMLPFMYKSTDNMMIQMLRQLDADYSTNSAQIKIFNDTTKDLLYTVAEHSKTKAFNTFSSLGYPANYLNAGQCIFAVDSTAGATWMGTDAPLVDIPEDKLVHFQLEVMSVPQFDPESPRMISQGPSMCIFNKEDTQEVLASWLFAQYMLTNQVQIAYAQTEGYVPVTSKAQQSETYQDYLSREGEDNDLYYWAKLKASKLLLDNVDNTFVTPVFNGSASLRNAAGQLIEEARKAARQGKTIDDRYMENLFAEMTALYRLDQTGTVGGAKQEQGTLPKMAIGLLAGLAVVWLGIGAYVTVDLVRKKKAQKKIDF